VRLIRALEIAEAIGTTPLPSVEKIYDALWIGIDVPVDILYEKIEARLKARMKHGMLAEAKSLHADGLSWKRMEALGLEYRFMARLLQKHITRVEFDRDLATEIRHYAKRQRMYWRRNKEIVWMPAGKTTKTLALVRRFI
jgi:tRNA dimethylallyltransferase